MPLLEGLVRLAGWVAPIVILAVIILPQAIRILREYERGVIFRLGKLLGAKGPGLIFLIPIVDRMVRMDLRVVTISVERQEVMTRDNVPVTVDAVVYFRVVDPQAAVVKVVNFLQATSLIAQTTLRSVLGQAPLDDLLSQRETINQKLQEIIDRQTEPWGVKVNSPSALTIFARRSRSASACFAIARFIVSGNATSFTSTAVTLTPHGSVCRSMISCNF